MPQFFLPPHLIDGNIGENQAQNRKREFSFNIPRWKIAAVNDQARNSATTSSSSS
jgi:hypothetical protein